MRITLLLIFIIILVSCKSEIKKENNTDSKEIDLVETISGENASKKIKKTHLSELLEKGLIISDSIEDCNNYKFEFDPTLTLNFNFDNNQKLILAEYEYGIIDNELELSDFSIYDCKKDSILLRSCYTIADYKIIEIKPDLVIEIFASVPNQNNIDKIIFSKKIFKELNNEIIVENEILYQPNKLTQERIDEITNLISNSTEDYSSHFEKIISDLFIATINGNEKMKVLFFRLKNNKYLDGGSAELYGDYRTLLSQVGIK